MIADEARQPDIGERVTGKRRERKEADSSQTEGHARYLTPGRRHRTPLPHAPATAVYLVGTGMNVVYTDWENDVVAVIRWIRDDAALDDVVGKIVASIRR